MRQQQTVNKGIVQKLKELDKDFACIAIGDNREFVEMTELPKVAGTHDIRSFLGALQNGFPVATIWHYTGTPVKISIESPGQIEALDFSGKPVTLEKTGHTVTIPIGAARLSILFSGISAPEAAKALADARIP
jgi:hypothetical protein